MRESNFQFPSQNRAVVSITHMLYDRRALDTGSPLAILNNLTSLTYLTSTSPRIREILTLDGGLERLLDILRESTLPRQTTFEPDLWGLNGPPTARVISVDRQTLLKHSLAFQCVVNIGVRGSEQIRTRVVQGGALDLVAQILESWLKEHGIAIFASNYGSQAAVDAHRLGQPVPGTESRRRTQRNSESSRNPQSTGPSSRTNSITSFLSNINPRSLTRLDPSRLAGGLFPRTTARQDPAPMQNGLAEALVPSERRNSESREDTDVDMADGEGDVDVDGSSVGADESMDLDEPSRTAQPSQPEAGPSTTPRASRLVLPMTLTAPIPIRATPRETPSQASSATGSVSDAGEEQQQLPRIISDGNLQAANEARPPSFIGDSRLREMTHPGVSTQSSPAGTPTRAEMGEGRHRRRDTIVARPLHLVPRNERDRGDGGSELSDGGPDVDIMTATIAAGVAAAQNLAGEGGIADTQDGGNEDNLDVAVPTDDGLMGEPDQEALEREQARLDMEAGAPPTQLAAAAIQQTPIAQDAPTPRQAPLLPPPVAPLTVTAAAPGVTGTDEQPAQIIIASGAPRGFQDLGSYVGISSLLHPDGDRYSDDSILLALQLLAYLSKYPHVRAAFHHPRKPMHPTFDLSAEPNNPLPERPACSETPNIFALVERFTFRPSPSDPLLFKVPPEIQYWAGVIMRNACRKDDIRGGIRQCAHMSCGKWEAFAREFAKCRRCRKAKYCSKECQSRAWSEGHKFWCNARGDGEGPSGHPGGPGGGGPPRPPPGEDDDNDSDFSNMDVPRERRHTSRTAGAANDISGAAMRQGGGGGRTRNAGPWRDPTASINRDFLHAPPGDVLALSRWDRGPGVTIRDHDGSTTQFSPRAIPIHEGLSRADLLRAQRRRLAEV